MRSAPPDADHVRRRDRRRTCSPGVPAQLAARSIGCRESTTIASLRPRTCSPARSCRQGGSCSSTTSATGAASARRCCCRSPAATSRSPRRRRRSPARCSTAAADVPARQRFAMAGGRMEPHTTVVRWSADGVELRSVLTGECEMRAFDWLVAAETPIARRDLASSVGCSRRHPRRRRRLRRPAASQPGDLRRSPCRPGSGDVPGWPANIVPRCGRVPHHGIGGRTGSSVSEQ